MKILTPDGVDSIRVEEVGRSIRGSVSHVYYGPAHDIKTGGTQVGGGLRLKF